MHKEIIRINKIGIASKDVKKTIQGKKEYTHEVGNLNFTLSVHTRSNQVERCRRFILRN